MQPLGAERLERLQVEPLRLADQAAQLRHHDLGERQRRHRAGGARLLEREVVARQPGADRPHRRAEHVHREEVQRHRRAAQRRLDHVVDRRVDRGVIGEHHADAEPHQQREADDVAGRPAEAEEHQRRADDDRAGADDQTAVDPLRVEAIGQPPADGQPADAREAVDAGGDPAGVDEAHVVEAREERRHERAERVHVEVVQRSRHDDPQHRRNREHQRVRIARAPARADGVLLERAARRLGHAPGGDGAQDAGDCGDVEGVAPAPVLQNPAARAVGQTEAKRQAEHPDRDRARAHRRLDDVADQRGGGRGAGRLADADAEARDDQLRKAAGEAGRRGQQAPDEDARRENLAALDPVRQPPERQPDHGVEQGEDGAEQAEGGVAERPLPPDALADAAEQLAVEEVHQVDREEHGERVSGT